MNNRVQASFRGLGHRVRATRLILLLLVASVALSGCEFSVYKLPLPGGTDVGDNPIEVKVVFADVLDLVPQSTVKVNDVDVGQVTDIALSGRVAETTLLLRRDVKLPDDVEAKIRQTSLLGEKFVSLEAPADDTSSNLLADGDIIPLERSGANPDVEEVLGALSLLLNGGGVAQLRTIARELNLALEGRESETKSALNQIDTFVSQLDDNKGTIVRALEDVNRLSVAVRAQQPSIDNALEELPSALLSLDRQRDDLIRMLTALNDLSGVGVRVIRQSKASTIEALRQLNPTLTQLADSGDALVNAFNVFLTYPFVDEVVGRDPQVARSLKMGDYTNLSAQLDIDLTGLPGLPCTTVASLASEEEFQGLTLNQLLNVENLCDKANLIIQTCAADPTPANCVDLPGIQAALCGTLPPLTDPLCPAPAAVAPRSQRKKNPVPDVPDLLKLPGAPSPAAPLDLNRSGVNGAKQPPTSGSTRTTVTIGELMDIYDPALTSLLVSPMVVP